jgi:hypothetical protein
MVRGKPTNRLARQVDLPHHSNYGFCHTHAPTCENMFCIQDKSMVIQSCCRRTSCTLDVHMVPQSLVVALIHAPEYEGNGCPERKVSERVS